LGLGVGTPGGFYHCISRVVDHRMILGDTEKENFCTLMRKGEYFSCIQILTHCTLDNQLVCRVAKESILRRDRRVGRLRAMGVRTLQLVSSPFHPLRRRSVPGEGVQITSQHTLLKYVT